MVCNRRRVSFIHTRQTALPFEHSPLAGVCPLVVLLDEEEIEIAFPTKTEPGVGQTNHPVEIQDFNCEYQVFRFWTI